MLSAEEIFNKIAYLDKDGGFFKMQRTEILKAMRIYRNQGIQQASEVCCETLTDGFRISNIPAVLALKEEV